VIVYYRKALRGEDGRAVKDISEMQKAARALRSITLPLARKSATVVAGLLAALILSAIILQLPSRPVLALLEILAMAFALFAILLTLRPGASYVTMDSEGITRCIALQKQTVRWSEIRSIRTGWIGYELAEISWNRQVLVSYCRDNHEQSLAIAARMFGMNADALMGLLDLYRKQVQGIEGPPNTQSATSET